MRQAGRTDPEYVAIRTQCGLELEDLFCSPELAAEITLLPRRLGVDALIIFQDILTPLAPMGARFVFRPGPVLAEPVRDGAAIEALSLYDVAEELQFLARTFQLVQEQTGGEIPVLGFAGAPWTLLAFLVEGKSPFGDGRWLTALLRESPDYAHRLLDKLCTMTIEYLRFQAECGAAAVQVFESAAPMLSDAAYEEFALPYQQRIMTALKGTVPTIVFARDRRNLEQLASAGADVISLPASISISEARRRLGAGAVVQGNLSNALLAEGPLDAITDSARRCIAEGGHRGHIFNLDHGLLKHTPYDHIVHLVKVVRETIVEPGSNAT